MDLASLGSAECIYTPPPCPGKTIANRIYASLSDSLARAPAAENRKQRCAPLNVDAVETGPPQPRTAANHNALRPPRRNCAPPVARARRMPHSFDGGPLVIARPPHEGAVNKDASVVFVTAR